MVLIQLRKIAKYELERVEIYEFKIIIKTRQITHSVNVSISELIKFPKITLHFVNSLVQSNEQIRYLKHNLYFVLM